MFAVLVLAVGSLGIAVPAQANTTVNCSVSSVSQLNTCIANANAGAGQDITIVLNNDMTADRNLTALDLPATSTMVIDGNLKTLNLAGFKGFDLQVVTNQTITVNGLIVTGGATTGDGGALLLRRGKLSANNITIKNSSATGYGGGIAILESDYPSTITRATISGNSAGQYGGGIYAAGVLTLTNSTVYGNTGGGIGGVMASGTSSAGISSLRFTTISGNSASGASSNIGAFAASTQLRLIGSVISNPLGSIARNCEVAVLSASYSVIGNTAGTDTSCGAAVANQIQLATTAALALGAFDSVTGTLTPSSASTLVNHAPDALSTGITIDQLNNTRSGAFTVGAVQVDLAAVTASPSTLAFGSVVVGSTSTASTITVTNSGSSALTFGAGAVQLAGSHAGDFAISSNTCTSSSVAIGSTCAVSIRFAPSVVGSRSASLTFADNAANSPQSLALSGTGGSSGGGGGSGGGSDPVPAPVVPVLTPTPTPTPSATPVVSAIPVTVRSERNVSIVLNFQRGTARLTESARSRLVSFAAAVPKSATQVTVRIAGVTGASGSQRTQTTLAKDRASTVASVLRSLGVRGTYLSSTHAPVGIDRDRAGKVAVSTTYTA